MHRIQPWRKCEDSDDEGGEGGEGGEEEKKNEGKGEEERDKMINGKYAVDKKTGGYESCLDWCGHPLRFNYELARPLLVLATTDISLHIRC